VFSVRLEVATYLKGRI